MKSKYINTFDTTAEYNNYIESAYAEFPNVGYDKQADKVNIVRISPNDHLFYGELVDATQSIPEIRLSNGYSNVKTYTPTVDTINNTFYIDDWGTVPTFNTLSSNFLNNKSNIMSIKKFKGLNTSNVTTMYSMFFKCSSLTSLDLSDLNTSNVSNFSQMFYECSSLTSLDLSNFNTSNATDMNFMFHDCTALTSLDLSNWDTSNVTTVNGMFSNCTALSFITLNNVDDNTYNQILGLDTSRGDSYMINYGYAQNITVYRDDAELHWNGTDWS